MKGEESTYRYSRRLLTLVFIAFKLCQLGLIFLNECKPFDNSTQLLLAHLLGDNQESKHYFWNRKLWNKLLSWDAAYFIKGIVINDIENRMQLIEFEHEYAFSRFWIAIVRSLKNYLNVSQDFYNILKFTIILNNILHFLSMLVLYQLTLIVFRINSNQGNLSNSFNLKRLAFKSSLLFIFSGGAAFLTTIYSENLSFFASFIGILFHEMSVHYCLGKEDFNISWQNWFTYMISMICFTIAAINRSNCILLGVFYLNDLYQLVYNRRLFLKGLVFPFIAGMLMFCSILIQWYIIPYKTFCPERGQWCNYKIFPDTLEMFSFFTKQTFYSFIQGKYWNVGFLKYWTINNIPNFLFSLPNIVIFISAVRYFQYKEYNVRLNSLKIITLGFLFVIIFIAHVQIINRISTFIPLHLWYISDVLNKTSMKIEKDKSDNIKDSKSIDLLIVKFYIFWLTFWIPIQTVLFTNFLPPA